MQLRTDPELRIRPQFKLPDWLLLASWSFGGLFSSFPTRTDVFGAWEGKRDGCLLGAPTRLRPVLCRPAPPRRLAVSRPIATRPWFVRFLGSTGSFFQPTGGRWGFVNLYCSDRLQCATFRETRTTNPAYIFVLEALSMTTCKSNRGVQYLADGRSTSSTTADLRSWLLSLEPTPFFLFMLLLLSMSREQLLFVDLQIECADWIEDRDKTFVGATRI